MKKFDKHAVNIGEVNEQLEKFEQLLKSRTALSERDVVLPFFKENRQFAACIGLYVAEIAWPDLIAHEFDVFGDFTCDLAVGSSRTGSFLLVEFEDAKKNSLFSKGRNRVAPEWGSRVEKGVSQVVDWFWKLHDMEKTSDYADRFGAANVTINGLVVVGRDQDLEDREVRRLNWRQEHTIIQSKKVTIVTFDDLLSDTRFRLDNLPRAVHTED